MKSDEQLREDIKQIREFYEAIKIPVKDRDFDQNYVVDKWLDEDRVTPLFDALAHRDAQIKALQEEIARLKGEK